MKKLGLIINPMAGIGGKVGLKGSDGDEIRNKALSMGAVIEAPLKASKALAELRELAGKIDVITCPGLMGGREAEDAGFRPQILEGISQKETRAEDTQAAARQMLERGVDLILFAGGDGTARDICEVIGTKVPALGIPAGVKIHSGVYGATPQWAGKAAALFLQDSHKIKLREMEVMDIDEEAFRQDRVSARLYGFMNVPYERTLLQSAKAGSVQSEEATLEAIASDIVTRMEPDDYYIVGPGTTPRAVMKMLGLPATLLGVDVVKSGKLICSDANENTLLALLEGQAKGRAHLIVTVIGGQGYVFGRGNQQISGAVIEAVGKENIEIIATESKMLALGGRPLLVDTGDERINRMLCGYWRVITSMNRRMAYRMEC